MHRLLASLLILAGLLSLDARAANISTVTQDGVTKVIVIAGVIAPGDAQKFANIALMTDDAVVALASDGGALKEALNIGRAIRLKGFSTYVTANSRCASACALIWLAGVPRQMASTARVGFHAAYYDLSGVKEISASGNAIVGSYLNTLGLPERAVLSLTSAPPTSVRWFSPAQVRGTGVDVTIKDLDGASEGGVTEQAQTPRTTEVTKDVSSLGVGAAATPADVEAQARIFAARYLTYENEEAARSLALMSDVYDDKVSHFGKMKTRQEVLAEHALFVTKWPNRKQSLKQGSVIVQCKAPQAQCMVDALIDWEVASGSTRTKGVSTWHLVLNRQSDRFSIVAVDGKVIERRNLSTERNRGPCFRSFCPFDLALR
jgi:hypothetical protein